MSTMLRSRNVSLVTKVALVMTLAIAIVGGASYIAGERLLSQVASLAEDESIFQALGLSRRVIVELAKERQERFALQVKGCVVAAIPLSQCETGETTFTLRPATKDEESAAKENPWLTETAYFIETTGAPQLAELQWKSLQPQFQKITDLVGTREHISGLLPSLGQSFRKVFALALGTAVFLALLLTIGGARSTTRRLRDLISYTKELAGGALSRAPASTAGKDEIGTLALALENMAVDLEEAKQKIVLTEKMTSWQNVARKVAHEIKNPLTPISLVTDELDHLAPVLPENHRESVIEAVRILREETFSLRRMVREFSAFARLPSATMAPEDFVTVVRDYVKRNKGQDNVIFVLKTDGAKDGLPVRCDRAMIAQILHNLVNNARLAKDPAVVQITMVLNKSPRWAILDVEDDGPGVPEELRTSLFDAYVTSRSTGDKEKGMGLGLPISRKIAFDHQGSLVLHRSGSSGTTFRLQIPLVDKSQQGG